MEQRIEDDLEEFISRRGDIKKSQMKGIKLNKKILLDAANADDLFEIEMVSVMETLTKI